MTFTRSTVVATIALLSACKPPASPIAPPNDIAFRLEWSGPADLDLYVKEPAGIEISRHQLHSPSGGVHTGDCNAVLLVNNHLAPLPIVFKVTVLHGSRIVRVEQGSIAAIGGLWGPHTTNWK